MINNNNSNGQSQQQQQEVPSKPQKAAASADTVQQPQKKATASGGQEADAELGRLLRRLSEIRRQHHGRQQVGGASGPGGQQISAHRLQLLQQAQERERVRHLPTPVSSTPVPLPRIFTGPLLEPPPPPTSEAQHPLPEAASPSATSSVSAQNHHGGQSAVCYSLQFISYMSSCSIVLKHLFSDLFLLLLPRHRAPPTTTTAGLRSKWKNSFD